MMSRILICLLLLWSATGFSQNSGNQLRYRLIVSGGIITGESDPKLMYQLSTGVTFNRFYTGIGISADNYFYKTIPLFADVRINFGWEQNAFFYGNAGINIATKPDEALEFNQRSNDYSGKFYMDVGIGYRFPLNKLNKVSISAGYSRKTITNEKVYGVFCTGGNCPDQIFKYEFNLGRIIAKLSWEFGK